MSESRKTITASVRDYLDDSVTTLIPSLAKGEGEKSVIAKAASEGLTLQQYVQKDAAKAIAEAEQNVSYWLGIEEAVILSGGVDVDGEFVAVNKNTAKLLQHRVEIAQTVLLRVNEYALTTFQDGEQRRNHLIRTLYNRAINKNDTKALIYLIDRVDGKPGENKEIELDYDNAYNVYMIIHTLFKEQLEVLNSGSGTRMICCSRRAGKTHLCAAILLIECLRKPNTRAIYIGETMELSEQLLDSAFNEIIDSCNLRDRKGKRLDWKHLDNGSSILVRGLSNTKDPDQIRGNKAKIIVIDEFFHLKSELLEYMHREVLQPMQLDYADDYMFLCVGTPPSIKGTFGELAWKTWDVPHFMWTYRENPHPTSLEARDAYVENILKEKGLTWDSPFARREYKGEWVYDDDLLLYPDYKTYNPREAIPQFHVDMVLIGIDYGVGDNDSIIGIAWDTEARRGYEFHCEKFNRLDITDRTISQLQYLKEQVKYVWREALDFFPNMEAREANKRILWDADDNDQHVTDELNMNVRLDEFPELRLNIQNAHKTDKIMMFDKIKDLLRTASLLLIEDGKTADECDKTVLKRGPNGQVYPEVDSKVFHPDLLPAMRYALYNVIGLEAAKKV